MAILVGNGRFECEESLSDLLGPSHDVASFGGLLSDPTVGNFVVFEMLDRDSGQLQPELERAFAIGHADATVIFYYAGYVLAEPGRGLFLATADTELGDLKHTAVPLSWIKSRLRACRSPNVVVILDCCYAGASGAVDEFDIEQQLRRVRADVGADVHVIASPATHQTREAREVAAETGSEGRLTQCMVEGLATGAADRDGDNRTGVRDLNEYFGMRLAEERPLWSGPLEGADPEIVANPHPIDGVDLDAFGTIDKASPSRRSLLAGAAIGLLTVTAVVVGFLLTRSTGAPRFTQLQGYHTGTGMPDSVALLDDLDRLRATVNRTGWVEHIEPLDGSGPRYAGALAFRVEPGRRDLAGTMSLGLQRWAEMDFGTGVHGFGVAVAAGSGGAEVRVELFDGRQYEFDVRTQPGGQEFFGFVSREPIRRVRITAASIRFVAERLYLYSEREFALSKGGS